MVVPKKTTFFCKKYLYVTHICIIDIYIYTYFTAFYFFVSSPSSSSKPSAATLQKKTVEPSQRQLPRDMDNLFHNLFNRLLHDLRHLNWMDRYWLNSTAQKCVVKNLTTPSMVKTFYLWSLLCLKRIPFGIRRRHLNHHNLVQPPRPCWCTAPGDGVLLDSLEAWKNRIVGVKSLNQIHVKILCKCTCMSVHL